MVKMSVFDKVVNFIDPVKGQKRILARTQTDAFLASGYGNHGASTSRNSLRAMGSSYSPDEDIHDNVGKLRERTRELHMGSPLARSAILTVRTNVVGAGLKLKPAIRADILNMSEEQAREWERKVLQEFNMWANSADCDARRMINFYEMQNLALLSTLMSGDVFALLPMFKDRGPYQLAIDLVEADFICDPQTNKTGNEIIQGVELDKKGVVVAYHVSKKHPKSKKSGVNTWERVEIVGTKSKRRNVIHLLEMERPRQLRGVPFLSPVIELLKQLERYSAAEIQAAVISSFFTVFITSESGEGPNYGKEDSDDRGNVHMGNGTIVELEPGEKVETANPGRPNAVFDSFVTAYVRQIGAGLEIPYEMLIKHFTASYSASRAALLEAWKMFRMRREWFAAKFCQPIYEEFLIEAILRGRIEAPGFFDDPLIKWAYLQSEWHGPSQGQLNPSVEVDAAIKRVDAGFSTRARESMELTGTDIDSNIRQRIEEEKQMKQGGLLKDGKAD